LKQNQQSRRTRISPPLHGLRIALGLLFILIAAPYLTGVYFVQAHQTELLFPNSGPNFGDCKDIAALGANAIEVWRGTQRVRYLSIESKKAKGWVLMFHGNGGSVCNRTWWAQHLKSDGWNLAMAEYPGYGGDGNVPGQALLMENSLAVYDAIHERNPSLPVVAFGESLGSGFATYVASERPMAGLVLSTPYPSITAVASHRFYGMLPISWMNRNPVPAELWAPKVSCAVLALHGDQDKLIPISMGRQQAANFKTAVEFVTVPGADHNDLAFKNQDLYWGRILDFIALRFNRS
jgi:alpha-beta hydrolase superfamily lysophospholipase